MDIQVRDDIIAEDPEQFFVSLSEFGDRITISPSRATITILDDGDGTCKLKPLIVPNASIWCHVCLLTGESLNKCRAFYGRPGV